MSFFKFRLQKILEHRENEENIEKGNYAKAQIELEKELNELDRLNKLRDFTVKEKQEQSKQIVVVNNLKLYNMYLNNINKKIEIQEQKVKQAKKKAEEAREVLISAMKERKIMENLKMRDYSEYLYEQKKEEEKVTDQFVSYSSSTNIAGD